VVETKKYQNPEGVAEKGKTQSSGLLSSLRDSVFKKKLSTGSFATLSPPLRGLETSAQNAQALFPSPYQYLVTTHSKKIRVNSCNSWTKEIMGTPEDAQG
jgi:hypothetical protein